MQSYDSISRHTHQTGSSRKCTLSENHDRLLEWSPNTNLFTVSQHIQLE
jgi:hypothetical protein